MFYLYLCICTSAKCMSVELKVYLFIWSHNFRFSMSLSLSPNSLYRQTTDCTEGGGLTREHCKLQQNIWMSSNLTTLKYKKMGHIGLVLKYRWTFCILLIWVSSLTTGKMVRKSNGMDNKFDNNFLIICRYLNLVNKTWRIIL